MNSSQKGELAGDVTTGVGSKSARAMVATRTKLVAAGFKETKLGIYETRDWNVIRNWAKEIVQKVYSGQNASFKD